MRKKVKLAFIESSNERKMSFLKKKKGLIKKLEEITVLCGIAACAIFYGPYEAVPELWPPSLQSAQELITRFRLLPDRYKKTTDHESFTRKMVGKMQEQMKRQEKGYQEEELTNIIHRCLGGEELRNFRGLVDFKEIDLLIDKKVEDAFKRMAWLKKHTSQLPPPQMPLESIGGGTNNESMVASQMPLNEMENLNSPLAYGSDMVNPGMQNVTWSTNYDFSHGMAMNAMQNVTWPTNIDPMVAPEMPINEMPNLAGSANNASMVSPEMSINQMQNLSFDMDMLSINQQQCLDDFLWDDPFFQSIINNDGAGPSNSAP